jgi:hypothetical protein
VLPPKVISIFLLLVEYIPVESMTMSEERQVPDMVYE